MVHSDLRFTQCMPVRRPQIQVHVSVSYSSQHSELIGDLCVQSFEPDDGGWSYFRGIHVSREPNDTGVPIRPPCQPHRANLISPSSSRSFFAFPLHLFSRRAGFASLLAGRRASSCSFFPVALSSFDSLSIAQNAAVSLHSLLALVAGLGGNSWSCCW